MLTIKNWPAEKANELEEQVLLDIRQLVEASLAAAFLDLIGGETSGDVGL